MASIGSHQHYLQYFVTAFNDMVVSNIEDIRNNVIMMAKSNVIPLIPSVGRRFFFTNLLVTY
jgi:hypothetical protein